MSRLSIWLGSGPHIEVESSNGFGEGTVLDYQVPDKNALFYIFGLTSKRPAAAALCCQRVRVIDVGP